VKNILIIIAYDVTKSDYWW